MITVQTLRTYGLYASSLLALAACAGTPTTSETPTAGETPPATGDVTAQAPSKPAETGEPKPQEPAPQQPQGQQPRDPQAVARKALENARRSLDLRLFEDARNEAAFVLELDNENTEARDILQRCNQVLGDRDVPMRGVISDIILE
ncbi:MAG TPA: hypothetical protein VFT55_09580, partial [Planctomycetota bacterium]|nr:hypothetical protein [Planctomycetota bacterium]